MSKTFFQLQIINLSVGYKVKDLILKAVDDVTLTLNQGEVVGLAGESGCGKTTLGNAIMRLLPANGEILQGEILFNGKDLSKYKEKEIRKIRWKEMAMVFQGAINSLNPTMTIDNQMMETIFAHNKVTKKDAREKSLSLFKKVGINERFFKSYPHELSGGMKQRVMIAMSLVCDPIFLIADEPTTALDVIIQKKIMDLLKKIQQQMNLSMLLITHDLSVIAQTCDKCAIMYAGKLVEFGDIEQIFLEPLHPYTKALINAFPDIKTGKKIDGIPGAPPNLINPPKGCRFAPRCSYAKDVCTKVDPVLEEIEKDSLVACHFWKEIQNEEIDSK